MNDSELGTWRTLVDREIDGESLTAFEHARMEQIEASDPQCGRDRELFELLGDLQQRGALPRGTPSIVEKVVAQVEMTGLAGLPELDTGGPKRRLGTRTLRLGVGLSAVAAVAGIAFAWLAVRSDPAPVDVVARAELVYASGNVTVDDQPALPGAGPLAPGAHVEVVEGTACLTLDPDVDVCMPGGTRIRIAELAPADRQIDLLSGKAVANLGPQPTGTSFSIHAGEVRVAAVGTVFAVETGTDRGPVVATVVEGEVALVRASETRPLRAHQRATVTGSDIEIVPAARTEETEIRALVKDDAPWRAQDVAVLEIMSSPVGAAVFLDGVAMGHTPLRTLASVGPHALEVREPGYASAQGQTRVEPGSVRVERFTLTPEETPVSDPEPEPQPTRTATPKKPPSPDALLTRARGQLAGGDAKGAAGTYQRLLKLHPKSPEAHTILVPLGELQLDDLDRPSAALRSFERYLARRGGPLAQEARLGAIQALRELGRPGAEQEAIEAYLERHPQGWEAKRLRRRLSTLRSESTDDPRGPKEKTP